MKSVKNNWFMLKIMWQACPGRVIMNLLMFFVWRLCYLLSMIWLPRLVMQAIEGSADFYNVILFLLFWGVFSFGLSMLEDYCLKVYAPRTDPIIQEKFLRLMYEQAVRCDLSCYENPEFYNKYTRANSEILKRSIAILHNISNILSILVSGVLCIAVIARWEPLVVPIVVVCAVCATVIDKKRGAIKYECMKKTTPETRQMEYVKRTVFLQDYAKEMRLSNIFAPLIVGFDRALGAALKTTHRYYGISSFLRVLREIFMSMGVFIFTQGIIIYRYLAHHAYQLSDVVTILNTATQLQNRIYALSNHIFEFVENGLFAENVREFLSYEPKITDDETGLRPKASEHHIRLDNVSFTYEGKTEPVLRDITIDIPPKQKIAIVGHNGAGKSTLVKLLMRFYDVSGGEILLDGENVKNYCLSQYRAEFGTVFQDFKLFAATVAENVLLYPPQNEQDVHRAEEAICNAGLSDKINSLKNGMNTVLTKEFEEDGALLSGGEMQKIAVARVFAKPSAIAILDEPSSALDPISEYELFESMMRACADKTVIFISHRLSSAVMADKVYMLENGRIIEEGSHKELMERGGRYAEMFRMQSEKYRTGGADE